jgi:hypothetical protein
MALEYKWYKLTPNTIKALECLGFTKYGYFNEREGGYVRTLDLDKSIYLYSQDEPTAKNMIKGELPPLAEVINCIGDYTPQQLAQLEIDYYKHVEENDYDPSFYRYVEGVFFGQYEFTPNKIYTNCGKGSLTFFCNGEEYRLDGVSSSYPTYFTFPTKGEAGVWKKAPNHVIALFEAAYAQGDFDKINYTKMTSSSFDVYLSTTS